MILSALIAAAALASPAVARYEWKRLQQTGTVGSNKCLDNSDGKLETGNRVQMWDCVDSNENQRWTYYDDGKIRLAAHNEWCLGFSKPPGGNSYNGVWLRRGFVRLVHCWDDGYHTDWSSDGSPQICLQGHGYAGEICLTAAADGFGHLSPRNEATGWLLS